MFRKILKLIQAEMTPGLKARVIIGKPEEPGQLPLGSLPGLKAGVSSSSKAGFTLIEMMIVISIIALVMGFLITNVTRKYDQARVDATKIQIRQLGTVLDDFRRLCGRYPTTDEGLDALLKKPAPLDCKNYDDQLLRDKKLPQDAWGRDFAFNSDGSKYVLKSLGADGKEGGDGFNKDITSDDL